MNLTRQYYEAVCRQLSQIAQTQEEAVQRAAEYFAQTLSGGGWIYLFGSGHSHMMAEELFYRAGGLARIVPMLDGPLMLHESATASTQAERELSRVPALLQRYPLGQSDVLVVISNSGRNAVPVELAVQARRRGARVIALINLKQSQAWPSRHPEGTKLAEAADLVLDNCGAVGDAAVWVEDMEASIGPTSTVAGAVLLNMVVCAAVEKMLDKGLCPEVFTSSNTTGDQSNRPILERYLGRIPHL